MKGLVSFHPVHVDFFDDVIAPLAEGRKVNPEPFLVEALRVRRSAWQARRYVLAIQAVLEQAEPPRPDPAAKLWDRVKSQLERFDHKADPSVARLKQGFEPDLHADGRPFFVAESSAERVAEVVESYRTADSEAAADRLARQQLAKLDPEAAKTLDGLDGPQLSSDLSYRSDLLSELTQIFEIARAARENRPWVGPGSAPVDGLEAVAEELPWRSVATHARHAPFWIARDVDGLETVCRAAGLVAPDCLVPPWRLFAGVCGAYPQLRESLHLEVRKTRDLGAFVAPGEISQLLDFLNLNGARIIQAAARAGEGPAATILLRKIKECAVYAEKGGLGYLEASGIVPPERVDEGSGS